MVVIASPSWPREGAGMHDDALDGNAAQTRLIARQIASAIIAEQASTRSRFTASVPAWIACAMSMATLIWGAGTLSSQVNRNTNDIRDLKAVQSQRDTGDQQVRDRLARIEAKVDLLVEGAKR